MSNETVFKTPSGRECLIVMDDPTDVLNLKVQIEYIGDGPTQEGFDFMPEGSNDVFLLSELKPIEVHS